MFALLYFFAFQALLQMIQGLSNEQWNSINRILKNKNTGFQNQQIQSQTRNVIYNSYERWAIQQSHVFKAYHSGVCHNIRGDDLAVYGCIGLKKAVQNYNPEKCGLFTRYADFYVKGELYRGVKKLIPNTPLEGEIASFEINEANHMDTSSHFLEKWITLRENLTALEYRCVTYKYSFDFAAERSNEEVAYLMCCSHETVRMAVKKMKQIMQNNANILNVSFDPLNDSTYMTLSETFFGEVF